MLLIDNCEHVAQACAELVNCLLRTCHGIRVLATSREPLGIAGEITWDALDNHERAVLDRALYRTYAAAGITTDPHTHSRPARLMRDLASALGDMPGEVAASLYVRLQRFVDGSLSARLFAGPTNVELDRQFIVFQVRELAGSCDRWPFI